MNYRNTFLVLLAILYTFLNALLVVGGVLNLMQSFSLTAVIGSVIVLGMSLPVRSVYRGLENPGENLRSQFDSRRNTVYLATVLFVASFASFSYGYSFPGSQVLSLSFQASASVFFPIKLFYSGILGSKFSNLLFEYGIWQLQLLWVYLISDLLVKGLGKTADIAGYESVEDAPRASLIPFTGKADIEVYIVTGLHGFFRIPESFCRECNLFVKAAQDAAEQVDFDVDIRVKSYWTRFLRPLIRGGTHPPVMLVNGEIVAQGYDVPEVDEIVERLEESS